MKSNPASALRDRAVTLTGRDEDYAPLLDRARGCQYVLLGEASHGTDEFYRERARMTQLLIRDHGFGAVAIEGDFPDALGVHRYVTGCAGSTGADALSGFVRFPTWMWRNTVVLEFVEWLRQHNRNLGTTASPVGFYGLDLYSLHASIAAVLGYLERTDPAAAERARRRYACFDHYDEDARMYGYAASLGLGESCENEVTEQLVELGQRALAPARAAGGGHDELFFAEQNARLVKNAEAYYRSMFRGSVASWNLRDEHMMETLDSIVRHLEQRQRSPKVVVWAHNSHLGDARATSLSRAGELNLGQLVRQRAGRECLLLGFTTYEGTVTAASDWESPMERKRVRPALPDSHEALLHAAGLERALLMLDDPVARYALAEPRLERAIGVIYRPESERVSHYFEARLTEQFDAVVHIDESHALEPLEATRSWHSGEAPETYPFAV